MRLNQRNEETDDAAALFEGRSMCARHATAPQCGWHGRGAQANYASSDRSGVRMNRELRRSPCF